MRIENITYYIHLQTVGVMSIQNNHYVNITIHLPLSYQSLMLDLVINPPSHPPTLGSRTDPPMITQVCGMITCTLVPATEKYDIVT